MSFCKNLSYNPFTRTSIIFTIVFLTWYDLTPYSILLPITISVTWSFDYGVFVLGVLFYVTT